MDVFIARQPIFDRKSEIYAYELLFRTSFERNEFDGDSASATREVIANSLLTIGVENILCGTRAFVNFDRELLLGDLYRTLPPEMFVIEILESVEPDDDVLAACRRLRREGYTIALDDFVDHPRFEPLVQLAHLIKLDMRSTSRAEQERMVRLGRSRGVAMLAEKVETQEEFEWAVRSGYDYFQGYFFTRPIIVRGKQVCANKLVSLALLNEVRLPELEFGRLNKLISHDVSMSYKLLRYVNSALFHGQAEIHTIAHSLAMLGEEKVRQWAMLAALGTLSDNKPHELYTLSLVRARFCEILAKTIRMAEPDQAFLMGLFSLLDALIDLPLDQALRQANVAPSISAALLGTVTEESRLKYIHELAARYENGDWDSVNSLASALRIDMTSIVTAYAESTLWAHQLPSAAS